MLKRSVGYYTFIVQQRSEGARHGAVGIVGGTLCQSTIDHKGRGSEEVKPSLHVNLGWKKM